jgi:hypothetical protein
MALMLEGLHNSQFMFGRHAGIHTYGFNCTLQIGLIHVLKLLTRQTLGSGVGNSQVLGDRLGRKLMISRNHDGPNASRPTFSNRHAHFWARRI